MKQIDVIFVTPLPAFYKVNLLNRLCEKKRVFVIFLYEMNSRRNKDFVSQGIKFDYVILSKLQGSRLIYLWRLLKRDYSYRSLILSGWDSFYLWFLAFLSPKSKNAVVVESTYYESCIRGLRGLLKRFFLKRIYLAYASGEPHIELLKLLSFSGKIIKTKGVGVFKYVNQPSFIYKTQIRNFLYVGRLSEEKNLKLLIDVFNSLPDLKLNIIGFGPQEEVLKKMASFNISFLGAISNDKISHYYQSNDVFVLPSKSEPWGLVIEEAMNNGLPVIVSNKVGCSIDLVAEDVNGIRFDLDDRNSLKNAILKICNPIYYNVLAKNISCYNFEERSQKYVASFFYME